jgi:NADPH:quinone reductase-like Zn-dependent oxidoreductase
MNFDRDEPSSLQIPGSMAAVRIKVFGDPSVIALERLPVPEPLANEVLVKVGAAGVGPWDGWIRGGKSVLPQPLPLTLGADIAGTVVSAGKSSEFKAGQRVYGVTNKRFTGGYAEYASCLASMVAEAPERLSVVEAASAPVVAVTALQMLFKHARVKAGDRILIHGAAGNVGRYAVQMASAADIQVFASASQEHAFELTALGAHRVVDVSGPPDIAVEAVLDLVGDSSQEALFSRLRHGGSFVSAVTTPSAELADKYGVFADFMLVDVNTADLRQVAAMFNEGTIVPYVGGVMSLDDAARAHRMLERTLPAPRGKIVLKTASGEW